MKNLWTNKILPDIDNLLSNSIKGTTTKLPLGPPSPVFSEQLSYSCQVLIRLYEIRNLQKIFELYWYTLKSI